MPRTSSDLAAAARQLESSGSPSSSPKGRDQSIARKMEQIAAAFAHKENNQ